MVRVIIAEDEIGQRNLYTRIITQSFPDIEVVAVPDGESLVSRVMDEDFSLILTDVSMSMPGITGNEALRMIRSAGKTTPAYLMSSSDLVEVLARYCGATGHLYKLDPNFNTKLIDIVGKHCNN